MALTSKITSELNWTQYNIDDISSWSNDNDDNYTIDLYNGITLTGINLVWYASLTGNQSLNLSEMNQSWFESTGAINFTSGYVKGIVIDNLTSSISGTITLPFSSCSGDILISPSGRTILSNLSGWAVNLNDTIEIVMTALSGYEVGIIGISGI